MAAGRLTVYGRYYDILTGRIEKYDEGKPGFVPLPKKRLPRLGCESA